MGGMFGVVPTKSVEKRVNNVETEKKSPPGKVIEAIRYIPADVARALLQSNASDQVVEAVAMAAKRTTWRRASDRTTDNQRRITISARVPRAEGDYYKGLALASRRSLYQFVLDALEAEAARVEAMLEAGEDPGGQLTFWNDRPGSAPGP